MKTAFPGQKIEILYAGTGPFTPFALAMTGHYRSDEIQFTALDIHLQSLDALRKIVTELNLKAYFRDYVQCDATTYTVASPPHIVITETMHRTVSREPHTAITLNLAPQLVRNGVFIPERVTVNASMSITDKEIEYLNGSLSEEEIHNVRVSIGTVFELSQTTDYNTTEDGNALVCASVTIPECACEKNELVLSTRLQLFGPIHLEEKESGITQPLLARDIDRLAASDG